MEISVRMARGGFMNLNAEGRVFRDDTPGQSGIFCDDFELRWPGGGIVANKNIASVDEAVETYIDTVINRTPF